MTNQIRTAKGVFEIHECSWGWGVLNVATGRVDERKTEAECRELLRSHGEPQPAPSVIARFAGRN